LSEETVAPETETSQQPTGKPQADAEREETAGAAQIAGLASKLAEKETALSETKERLESMAKTVTDLETKLSKAAASYQKLIATVHPEIPQDLITGGSVEEIDASLEKARSLVTRVKQGLETAANQSRVPPGAPPRTAPDISGMSPREKIQYGIGGRK